MSFAKVMALSVVASSMVALPATATSTKTRKEKEENEVKGVLFPFSKPKGVILESENKFFLEKKEDDLGLLGE